MSGDGAGGEEHPAAPQASHSPKADLSLPRTDPPVPSVPCVGCHKDLLPHPSVGDQLEVT